MAVFYHLRFVYLATLLLASHLGFTNAAVRVWGLKATNLAGDLVGNQPDPYVKVWCDSSFGGMTEHSTSNSNPNWIAEFNFPDCKVGSVLKFEVWDKDLVNDDKLGECAPEVVAEPNSPSCNIGKGTLYFNYST